MVTSILIAEEYTGVSYLALCLLSVVLLTGVDVSSPGKSFPSKTLHSFQRGRCFTIKKKAVFYQVEV